MKFADMLIPFGLSNVFVVLYRRLAKNVHIPSTIEYNCGENDLRHPPVDASSLKRLMFRSALTGVRIRLVALTGAIP